VLPILRALGTRTIRRIIMKNVAGFKEVLKDFEAFCAICAEDKQEVPHGFAWVAVLAEDMSFAEYVVPVGEKIPGTLVRRDLTRLAGAQPGWVVSYNGVRVTARDWDGVQVQLRSL